MANASRGDVLAKTRSKTRDRVVVKPGCTEGSSYDGAKQTKGTIVQTQEFNGMTLYLVEIDGRRGPGLWYSDDCLDIKQGRAQPLNRANQRWCIISKVESDGTIKTSRFLLDANGVDSYLEEGYTVILDDDRGEPPGR